MKQGITTSRKRTRLFVLLLGATGSWVLGSGRAIALSADSSEPYFPMMLSNGADAVLVDYSGTSLTGLANHAHHEQHQGCPCGWYKVGHQKDKSPGRRIQPIVQPGYMVVVDSEICDLEDYQQSFDPKRAVLRTRVDARGVICEVESFLTDEHVLVEHYRVDDIPSDSVRMAFVVDKPSAWISALQLQHHAEVEMKYQPNGAVTIDYSLDGVSGAGLMVTDRKPDGFDKYPYGAKGVYFDRIKPGWSATRFLILADPTDGSNYKDQLAAAAKACRSEGYAGLKRRHTERWDQYSGRSRISVPDERFQYIYDLSVYCLRANQHPQTGGITVGMLPHLWAGGTYVPYDAYYAHQALLATNHIEEGRSHLAYYEMQRQAARDLAKKLNLPGAIYSGWTNCFGQHRGGDIEKYALHYKPLMSAFIVLKHYWQWRYDPRPQTDREHLALMQEILDLAIARFIEDQGGEAIMKPCVAGNESDIVVENDTFNALMYARALGAFVEMAAGLGVKIDPSYAELSRKMYKGLEKNYKDGVLLPYRKAKYLATLQFAFFLFNLPEGIGPRSVYASLEDSKTRWGLDTSQPSEAYRDWPWLGSRAAIALAHLGDSKESFRWLRHPCKYATSFGAIPEKIRIDGYAIGYWFTSPHALLVWATCTALCHDGNDGTLRLLWGLDGQWKDLEFGNIRLAGGLLVSGAVRDGKIVSLKIKNDSVAAVERRIVENPVYAGPERKTVSVPAGAAIEVR